jgi:hypothetical protein
MWLDNVAYVEIGAVCAYSLYNLIYGPARHDSKTGKLRTLLFPTIMILIQTALLKSLYGSFPHPFVLEVVYMYFSFAYFAMMISYTRGKTRQIIKIRKINLNNAVQYYRGCHS